MNIEEINRKHELFKETYNENVSVTHPFRCTDRTEGYYTRKDGKPCTPEDVTLLYKIKTLGQETKFWLDGDVVKVFGMCDHGD